jgi:predicted amino acid dehydrogenase
MFWRGTGSSSRGRGNARSALTGTALGNLGMTVLALGGFAASAGMTSQNVTLANPRTPLPGINTSSFLNET